jgi:parallel beta-helix repeat protein
MDRINRTHAATLRGLIAALAVVASAAWVHAYPMYDDGAGNGCVSCHPAYFDDPSSPTPFGPLHQAHLQKFGISPPPNGTGACGLCHQNAAGGDIPVLTYWSAEGFGCAGCHGQDYGDTIPTGLGLSHEGAPKATAYGLRRKHQLIFEASNQPNVCATCHYPGSPVTGNPDPAPEIFPETMPPPYYNRPTNNLTDPCDSTQESWEGLTTTVGLDNDGNGQADYLEDSACQAFVPTTTTTVVTTSSTTTTTFPGTARRITVYPGQSIQDAINAVAPGGTVYVMPGTYQETHAGTNAIDVNKSGIRLIGRSKPKQGLKVILQASGVQQNGVVVQPLDSSTRIQGFQIKGFTIQGFPHNGILTRYLDDFKIERNESINNLENGIWPTLSANGLVKRNVSYGSEDSALWVEASENVRVLNNELYDSPTGMEITVSNNILVKKNNIHDNTAGIGLYHALGAGLPPLQPLDRNGDWQIIDNHVHDNNSTNSAPPGSLSALLPPGLGIGVIGVDRVQLEGNLVENNHTFGIAMADWCLVTTCPNPYPPTLPDSYPDDNTVVSNTLNNNGTMPSSGYESLAADLTYVNLFDPNSGSNCFAKNTPASLTFGGTLTSQSNKCP